MNAEHRFVSRIRPVEVAGAAFAFSTLAFFRDRREHSRRIHLVELVDHEIIGYRLFECFEKFGRSLSAPVPPHEKGSDASS
jgi:hypothetical protein